MQNQIKITKPVSEQTLVERLINRAKIRRSDPNRLSLKEGKPDKIAELLEEAADEIMHLENEVAMWKAESIGAWPNDIGPYKNLAKEVLQLRKQNIDLLKQILEARLKLESYRDLDAMLCK